MEYIAAYKNIHEQKYPSEYKILPSFLQGKIIMSWLKLITKQWIPGGKLCGKTDLERNYTIGYA